MIRKANVYINKELAGTLTKNLEGYIFRYTDIYFNDTSKPSISLTLPKTKQEYYSNVLLPFFYNMLAEGVNKELQNRRNKIGDKDFFGLLLATAQNDAIGAVTVKEIVDE